MIYMAYQYEDLDKKGMLPYEEEVNSSKKVESKTDRPEASTMSEVSKKPKVNRERARSEKEPATMDTCSNCRKLGHFTRNCKTSKK